ncbi:hypothetical protein GGR56DRAFT_623371 [Xylariaceae sp. FL0804]|nr:hypothetical protein GGR56DRAFT_623371 [Xylariaceae sp. FL0804]
MSSCPTASAAAAAFWVASVSSYLTACGPRVYEQDGVRGQEASHLTTRDIHNSASLGTEMQLFLAAVNRRQAPIGRVVLPAQLANHPLWSFFLKLPPNQMAGEKRPSSAFSTDPHHPVRCGILLRLLHRHPELGASHQDEDWFVSAAGDPDLSYLGLPTRLGPNPSRSPQPSHPIDRSQASRLLGLLTKSSSWWRHGVCAFFFLACMDVGPAVPACPHHAAVVCE